MTSQGLNLPHLVRVRSMMLPMMGSFTASKTLAAIMIAVIAESCATVSERVNRMYTIRKLMKRLYIMSLPTVPSGNMMRFLFLVFISSMKSTSEIFCRVRKPFKAFRSGPGSMIPYILSAK